MRGAILTIGYVLIGILGGFFAVIGSLMSGFSWILVIAAYPFGGMVAVFVVAMIAFAVPTPPGGGRRAAVDPGQEQQGWPGSDARFGIF